MNKKELELAGVLIYKCEGTKLRKDKRYPDGNTYYYAIEFTNSDPFLVRLFLKFINNCIGVNKEDITCELFLYPDQNIDDLTNKWSRLLKINQSQFDKPIVIIKKISKFKPNPLGTCKIRCYGKDKFIKLNDIVIKRLGKSASLIK